LSHCYRTLPVKSIKYNVNMASYIFVNLKRKTRELIVKVVFADVITCGIIYDIEGYVLVGVTVFAKNHSYYSSINLEAPFLVLTATCSRTATILRDIFEAGKEISSVLMTPSKKNQYNQMKISETSPWIRVA